MKNINDLIRATDQFLLIATADRVYGPYANGNQQRMIVIIIDDEGKRRTVSYPKYLVEQHLGRPLGEDETIDHLDRNHSNNSLNNLRIVPRAEHSRDDTRRVKNLQMACAYCQKPFERSPRLVRDKSNKGSRGDFCSRSCAGKYSREVQLGQREKLAPLPPPPSEYYRNIKPTSQVLATAAFLMAKYGIVVA